MRLRRNFHWALDCGDKEFRIVVLTDWSIQWFLILQGWTDESIGVHEPIPEGGRASNGQRYIKTSSSDHDGRELLLEASAIADHVLFPTELVGRLDCFFARQFETHVRQALC